MIKALPWWWPDWMYNEDPILRVLTIDGGGMKGEIALHWLVRICARFPLFLERVFLFGGTSTGTFITFGLAAGLDLTQLLDDYASKTIKENFTRPLLQKIINPAGLHSPLYSFDPLERLVAARFPNQQLGELRRFVIATSYQMHVVRSDDLLGGLTKIDYVRKGKWYHNFLGPGSDGTEYVGEVAMKSGSPPYYAPSYRGEFDGGLFAPNPIAGAVAQLRDDRYFDPITPLSNIRAFSIGTGHSIVSHPPGKDGTHKWGLIEAAKPVLSIPLEALTDSASFITEKLLDPGTFYRLNDEFPSGVVMGMDDASDNARKYRREFAYDTDLGDTYHWIKNNW
jgi:hypothetical protein